MNMTYELFLQISIVIFLFSIAIGFINKKPLKTLLFGTSLSLFFVFVAYRVWMHESGGTIISSSIFNTFRVFLFNEDLNFVTEYLSDERLKLYVSLLYVLAPVLLIGSVLTYLAEMSSRFKLLGLRIIAKELYIFSEINEKTALLAEDIALTKDKSYMLFSSCPESPDGELFDLVERIKKTGALCIKNGVTEQKWLSALRKKQLNWILASLDPHLNLQQGIALNEKYKASHHGTIYVFAEQIEAEMLLDAMPKENIKIRRVSEKNTIIQQLLLTHPLYENHMEHQIHLVVIGVGAIGTEYTKAATWCGQMEGYNIKITLADSDEKTYENIKFLCPELLESCDISFVKTNVETPELWDLLNQNLDATQIVIALPTDDISSRTAIAVRSYFERQKFNQKSPAIHVCIQSLAKSSLLSKLVNGQNQSYGLLPFGDVASLYKKNVLFNGKLERMALAMHEWLGYDPIDFDAMEYNRKASIAAALHVNYKLHSAGVNSLQAYAHYLENLLNKENQVRAEHLRWNAYMRSEGFISASFEEAETYLKSIHNHKNIMAAKHSCLIDFDQLDTLTEIVKPYREIDFKEQDVRSIDWVAQGCP